MKFYMTDFEISQAYRLAKNKEEQITILSHRNLVSESAVREKLADLGLLKYERAWKKPVVKEPKQKTYSQAEAAVTTRSKREKWKAAGLCVWCGGEKEDDWRVLCAACRAKARAKAMAKKQQDGRNGGNGG
ncbi:MAG: hypothetical protein IJV91_08135 [Kiritimatiellae bacterium]|nr:hypothetical protein [Kiritimatiellia bacterium]